MQNSHIFCQEIPPHEIDHCQQVHKIKFMQIIGTPFTKEMQQTLFATTIMNQT
jgi:hypothetical protein